MSEIIEGCIITLEAFKEWDDQYVIKIKTPKGKVHHITLREKHYKIDNLYHKVIIDSDLAYKLHFIKSTDKIKGDI